MSSSVIVCDVIFSLMRIIYKISIDIVKIIYVLQVNGGVAKCDMIVGIWFSSCGEFFLFFLLEQTNSITNEFI
jgi:hypothetical protein